jgi:hypothetical protein
LDGGYVSLSFFTQLIINPIIYSGNGLLRFICMMIIAASAVLRVILVIKLVKYR